MKFIASKIALSVALSALSAGSVQAVSSSSGLETNSLKTTKKALLIKPSLAQELGLTTAQYQRFMKVKLLSGEFYELEGAINIEETAAWVQAGILASKFIELPISLQDEIQFMNQHNLEIAADYVGVTTPEFSLLLSEYVKLTGTKYKAKKANKLENSVFTTSNSEDDEAEDDEDEENVEVITVTYSVRGSSALSLLNNGHGGMINRIQRDALNALGNQLGIINVTFLVPERNITVEKQYQYDRGSVSNNGDFTCTGACNDGNIFIPE